MKAPQGTAGRAWAPKLAGGQPTTGGSGRGRTPSQGRRGRQEPRSRPPIFAYRGEAAHQRRRTPPDGEDRSPWTKRRRPSRHRDPTT
jgi:hypothetical protein